MKRTTIYLDADLEVVLKLESLRSGRPAAEIIREALRAALHPAGARLPRGGGAFSSGRSTTAERAEQILRNSGFGEE